MTGATIVLMVVGIIVVVFLWMTLLMAVIYGIFRRTSGWQALSERYPAPEGVVGTLYHRQTVKVGAVRWRWAMTVGISDYGLYLAPSPSIGPFRRLVRHAPLLIPWSEIHVVGPGRIYLLWQCTELAIGEPKIASITVPDGLLALLAPHIPSAAK